MNEPSACSYDVFLVLIVTLFLEPCCFRHLEQFYFIILERFFFVIFHIAYLLFLDSTVLSVTTDLIQLAHDASVIVHSVWQTHPSCKLLLT